MQKPVVEVKTTIDADAATVWKAMTRKQSAMFPGTEVDTDWKVGHPISFAGEWEGKPFKDYGEIQALKVREELRFSHWSKTPTRPDNYHIVHYALEPDGEKTKVTLEQVNIGPDAGIDAKARSELKKKWAMMLDGLKKAVEEN
jgi:uncharacterized protein YndB with AHSA1/START domain